MMVSPPFLPPAHGNSLKTCADDLIKFGTTVSTAEPLLGKPLICSTTFVHLHRSFLFSQSVTGCHSNYISESSGYTYTGTCIIMWYVYVYMCM